MANGRTAARGRAGVFAAGLVVAAGGLTLGGCAGNEAEMDALRSENIELRERNDELQLALEEATDAYDEVAAERDRLRAENSELRAEVATLRARPEPSETGFEGMGSDVFSRPGELVVEVAGDVLFASGKAELREESKRELDRIARVIQQRYPTNEIRVGGHTDTDPIRKSGWDSNEHLSAMRALAVEEYLSGRGVTKDRMYAAAYGPSESKSSKQESRRVEIVILSPEGS
jgi:chemotaxis protein MotB